MAYKIKADADPLQVFRFNNDGRTPLQEAARLQYMGAGKPALKIIREFNLDPDQVDRYARSYVSGSRLTTPTEKDKADAATAVLEDPSQIEAKAGGAAPEDSMI